jgi:hypothetical protein
MKFVLFILLYLFLVAFKPPESTTPEAYGAKGDGVTDDGAAIQAALKSGKSFILFDSTKIYRSARQLIVPSGTTIIGNGAILKPHSNLPTGDLLPFLTTEAATIHNASGVAIIVKKNSNTFSYSGAGALKVGSLVMLQGPSYAAYNAGPYKLGWFSVVTQIAGNTVTLEHAAPANFTASVLQQYKTSKNIHIIGLHLDMTERSDGVACSLSNAMYSTMQDLYIESTPNTGITIGAWLKDCLHSRADNLTVLMGETQETTGFGIDVQGQDDTVSNCTVNGFHQPIISAHGQYISQGLYVLNNNVSNSMGGSGSAIDFHGNSQGIIDGNIIHYFNPMSLPIHGIHIRSDNTTVSNNIVTMETGTKNVIGIFGFENMTTNINIVRNTFRFNGPGRACMFQNSTTLLAPTTNLHINYNLVYGGAIVISGPIGTGFEVNNNRLEQLGTSFPYINIATTIIGNSGSISGNTFVNKTGNSMNYSISTSKSAVTEWTIMYDTVYVQDLNNTSPQFRINNTKNRVNYNVLFTNAACLFILDNSGTTGVNAVTNNKYFAAGAPNSTVSGAGIPMMRPNILPEGLPPATVNGTYLNTWKYRNPIEQ